jgi:hypothetical protein
MRAAVSGLDHREDLRADRFTKPHELLQQPERLRAALERLLEQLRVSGSPYEQKKTAQMNGLLTRLPSALENISALLGIERDRELRYRACSILQLQPECVQFCSAMTRSSFLH